MAVPRKGSLVPCRTVSARPIDAINRSNCCSGPSPTSDLVACTRSTSTCQTKDNIVSNRQTSTCHSYQRHGSCYSWQSSCLLSCTASSIPLKRSTSGQNSKFRRVRSNLQGYNSEVRTLRSFCLARALACSRDIKAALGFARGCVSLCTFAIPKDCALAASFALI